LKDEDYPGIYRAASDLSESAQEGFFRGFSAHMALLTIAVAISVAESESASLAMLQALVLLGALFCAIYLYSAKPDKNWYTGRAVAESIKTSTWRYMARAEPFDSVTDADRQRFGVKIKDIIEQNKGTASLLNTHLDEPQITDEMERVRALATMERREFYRENRILNQLQWYAKKAAHNRRMTKRFFIALIVVLLVAIALAIAKVEFPGVRHWPTDIFVTLAASLLSWIQAKKYQELAASYALTAHEISLIREQAAKAMTDAEFSLFVGDAENAFSREHTQWIARKDQ
jgi:hypothetical protein